jgi:hypothetical protein
MSAGGSGAAMAQARTREGANVSCDDGRRGILSGDAIISPDRHAIEPDLAASERHHRQQIICDRGTRRLGRPRQGRRPAG